jgi:hypothetical protein
VGCCARRVEGVELYGMFRTMEGTKKQILWWMSGPEALWALDFWRLEQ